MNKIQLLGTMTRDCELKYAQSGTAVGNFSIAWNEKIKSQDGQYADKAHFFDITAWGKTAENINKFFNKGSRILIDGQLQFSQWEKDGAKRSKVDIKVNSFYFIDRKDSHNQSQQHQNCLQAQQSAQAPNQQGTTPSILEIEINEDETPFTGIPKRLAMVI